MVIKNDEERAILEQFAYDNEFCWACGWEPSRHFDPTGHRLRLEIHHMRKRPRTHELWNLSRFCTLCHMVIEGHRVKFWLPGKKPMVVPPLTLADVMWLKMKHDPGNYERIRYARVASSLPRATKPPDWFWWQYQEHRRRNYKGARQW